MTAGSRSRRVLSTRHDDAVPVTIRRVRIGDGPVLRAIRLRALAESPDAFTSTFAAVTALPDAEWDDRATRGATGAETATFLAFTDVVVGMVVGMSGTDDRDRGDQVELLALWVAPEVRRAGVARALVGSVISWANSAGFAEVVLSVKPGNRAARRLYAAAGFTETSRRDSDGLVRMVRSGT